MTVAYRWLPCESGSKPVIYTHPVGAVTVLQPLQTLGFLEVLAVTLPLQQRYKALHFPAFSLQPLAFSLAEGFPPPRGV